MHIRSVFGFSLLALLLVGCVRFYSWNQRLTLFVNTPDGPMTASSVTHVDITDYPYGLPAATSSSESTLTGEAIVMLLPNGQYLFVLLPGKTIALGLFRDASRDSPHHFRYAEKQVGKEPVIVTKRYRPKMVTFTDMNDPLSALAVTPENFTEVFGAGYTFERLTLQITNDKVTSTGVVSVFGPDFFRLGFELSKARGFARDKTPAEILALFLSKNKFIESKK